MADSLLQILPWLTTVGLSSFVPISLIQYQQSKRRSLAEGQLQSQVALLGGQLNSTLQEQQSLLHKLEHSQRQSESFMVDINQLRDENRRLREQLEQPTRTEVRYGIATVGVSQCGKTAVTLPWANQLARPEAVKATVEFSRYERTVNRVYDTDARRPVDHIFEFYDWGGEHVEDALTALVKLGEIHALLLVVDLGEFDKQHKRQEFSQARIARQIDEFDKHVLRFFFSPAVVAHCKHYILFINKADILGGLPQEIEEKARAHYQPLISQLDAFAAQRGVNFTVMVGSAHTGHRIQALFRHLIENLLPPEALGPELRQELERLPEQAAPTPRGEPSRPHIVPPTQPVQAQRK